MRKRVHDACGAPGVGVALPLPRTTLSDADRSSMSVIHGLLQHYTFVVRLSQMQVHLCSVTTGWRT